MCLDGEADSVGSWMRDKQKQDLCHLRDRRGEHFCLFPVGPELEEEAKTVELAVLDRVLAIGIVIWLPGLEAQFSFSMGSGCGLFIYPDSLSSATRQLSDPGKVTRKPSSSGSIKRAALRGDTQCQSHRCPSGARRAGSCIYCSLYAGHSCKHLRFCRLR